MLLSFFVRAFHARFRASVTPSSIAAFFLLPLSLWAVGLIFNGGGLSIRAGVYIPPESGAVAGRVLDGIIYYGRNDCEIVVYGGEEELKQDVAAHRLECGYVLTPAVEAFELEGAIRAYRSPMTVTEKVLDLIVAAAYVETLAGRLGEAVLRPYADMLDIDEPEETAADIQERANAYLSGGALMEMVLVETGGPADREAEPAPYRRLFHGLAGLAAMILALLLAMGLAGDAQKAAYIRLKPAGGAGAGFALAGFTVVFTAVLAFFIFSVTIGGQIFPGLSAGWGNELLMSGAYAFALAGVSALLTARMRPALFPALISSAFIFAALCGGAFFDLREVLAAAAPLRYAFLNYYYLDGVNKSVYQTPLAQAAVLCGVGAVTGVISARGRA